MLCFKCLPLVFVLIAASVYVPALRWLGDGVMAQIILVLIVFFALLATGASDGEERAIAVAIFPSKLIQGVQRDWMRVYIVVAWLVFLGAISGRFLRVAGIGNE